MKRITLLFVFFTHSLLFAQTTNIPDANFEQALIDLGYDTALDGEVLTSNISGITSLDVQNESISNFEGIEDFLALQELYVDNNNLTSLNLSQNTALTLLSCTNNNLVDLDVSSSTSLWYLDARFNQLSDLNLSQNTSLQILTLEDNLITLLNLNHNTALSVVNVKSNKLGALSIKNGNNASILTFDATNNPGLLCVQVEDVAYSNTNWTNIDAQTSFSLSCSSQLNTYVPDDNFEQALIDLGYDTTLDDYVLTSNISSITLLNVEFSNIDDLTGIEDFVSLEVLQCGLNNLTHLNVSQNTALTELSCHTNNLTSLNVSQNTQLEIFYCSANQLTSLDVSQNAQLKNLQVHKNQLTSLDVSQNTQLTFLNVNYNDQLTSLNVKNGNNTSITTFSAANNPNLICIQVDDVAYSTANWTIIDTQTIFNEDCSAQTYVPDDNFEQALIDLGYDIVLDDYVFTTNISSLTTLNLHNKGINDLTGIEDFLALETLTITANNLTTINLSNNLALETLECSANQLTSLDISQNLDLTVLKCNDNPIGNLDVSQNINLTHIECIDIDISSLDISQNTMLQSLECRGNQLTSIDLSQNTALTYLNLLSNQLTSIDVSNNHALVTFVCENNLLTSLNVSQNTNLEVLDCNSNPLLASLNMKNGNNTLITTLNALNNPNLTCIEVDNVTYSTTNWTFIDAQTSFSENCHYNETYVPDDNFEQALIDLGLDSGTLDDYVLTSNIEGETTLYISSKNISDLTGIEAFTALETFLASTNSITTANFSQNKNLTYINLTDNSLTDIDVSQNTVLTHLYLNDNLLTSIDISNNTALEILGVSENQLGSIDVSANTLIEELGVYNNKLSSLNVNALSALEIINCSYNQMEQLNFSNNSNLTAVSFNDNSKLVGIDISNGNNNTITYFNALNCPNLYCVKVDNATYSTTNWTNIDSGATFAESCGTLDIASLTLDKKIDMYPNPVKNYVMFKVHESITISDINIYNTLGKKVLTPRNFSNVNVRNLKSGLYLVKIEVANNSIVKKLIVE